MNFIKRWLLIKNAKELTDYSGLSISEAIELKKEYQKEVDTAKIIISYMVDPNYLDCFTKSKEIIEFCVQHKNKYETKIAMIEKCFDLSKINCRMSQ